MVSEHYNNLPVILNSRLWILELHNRGEISYEYLNDLLEKEEIPDSFSDMFSTIILGRLDQQRDKGIKIAGKKYRKPTRLFFYINEPETPKGINKIHQNHLRTLFNLDGKSRVLLELFFLFLREQGIKYEYYKTPKSKYYGVFVYLRNNDLKNIRLFLEFFDIMGDE